MRNFVVTGLMALAGAQAALAVSVRDCDGATDSVRNVVEPWEGSTKQFYNKLVRVVHVDTGGEPVCCSSHLAVIYPSPGQEEPVYTDCKLVGSKDGMGFLSIGFNSLTAKYDARTGLTITFPYTTYNDSGENHPAGVAKLRLDLKAGTLTPAR
jgi:hypothetical protein